MAQVRENMDAALVPLVWCVVGGATRLALESAEAWVSIVAGCAAFGGGTAASEAG